MRGCGLGDFPKFYLTRVGIRGVKKPVQVKRPGRPGGVTVTPTFDVFVDLPPDQKGSHLSRNAEIINQVMDDSVREPVPGLEDLCDGMVRELLKRHTYALNAEVVLEADYFLERTAKSGKKSLEPYGLMAHATAQRKEDGSVAVKKLIGVKVLGMTACPCAMEEVRGHLQKKYPHAADHFADVNMPVISHNQRNISTVMLEVPEGIDVEADNLIDLIEGSQSSATREILKRADEAALVLDAHMNPKFVEDVVRDILKALLGKYPNMPDGTEVLVRSESEESIHKHNAFAERKTTFGELRKPLEKWKEVARSGK